MSMTDIISDESTWHLLSWLSRDCQSAGGRIEIISVSWTCRQLRLGSRVLIGADCRAARGRTWDDPQMKTLFLMLKCSIGVEASVGKLATRLEVERKGILCIERAGGVLHHNVLKFVVCCEMLTSVSECVASQYLDGPVMALGHAIRYHRATEREAAGDTASAQRSQRGDPYYTERRIPQDPQGGNSRCQASAKPRQC